MQTTSLSTPTDSSRALAGPLARAGSLIPALGLLLAVAACDAGPPPVVGVTSSQAYVDAVALAVEQDMAAHGSMAVDTLLRPETGNTAGPALGVAAEFVGVPGIVAVIGHSNSSASIAASQVYNRHGVVQIAPTASATMYSQAGDYSFRLVPPDNGQGAFLAAALRESLEPGASLAVLYVNDDYGRGLRTSVMEGLDALGHEPRHPVVLDMPHTEGLAADPGMRDHLVEAVTVSGAHAILWLGRASALDAALPEIRQRLGGIPIFGGDALASAVHLRKDGRWDGVTYVEFVDLDATPEARDFARRYRERFGEPAGGPEALTHDAMALVLAATRAGATTPTRIREYLLSLGRERPPFPGVTGPIRFDERGDVERSYHLALIQPGEAP